MAISLLNQSDVTADSPGASTTLTHTVSDSTDTYLLVFVSWENNNFETVTVYWDVAGANEQLTEINGYETGDDASVYAYGLINPTPGTSKLITVNFSPNLVSAGVATIEYTLSGVHQSSPIRQYA